MNDSDHFSDSPLQNITFLKVHFSVFENDYLYNVFEQSSKGARQVVSFACKINYMYNVLSDFQKMTFFGK
mgnify:CR=1 FL=1